MYIKKKKGFLLVEVIVILNIFILLLTLFSKQINSNIEKLNHYVIKDDILTLTEEEELFIIEINNKIFEDCKSKKCKKYVEYEIEKYVYSENSNIRLEVKNETIFLVNRNKNKISRRLEIIEILEDKCMVIPTEYLKIENR